MEFYLVSDLECDLVVFHPYRTLLTLCGKEAAHAVVSEAGEVGVGVDDGPRYWGTGEGRLELEEGPLQTAWYIVPSSQSPRTPLPLYTDQRRACVPPVPLAGSSSTTHTAPSSVCSTHHT
jgi:hypothetical protein